MVGARLIRVCFLGFFVAVPAIAAAQSRPAQGLKDRAQLFAAGCAGCHGPQGSGAADSTVGFEKPSIYPDFTSCEQTSPEVQQDFTVEVELLYQPIGFRWAQNLKCYDSAFEPHRFTGYYDAMASGTVATLARATR